MSLSVYIKYDLKQKKRHKKSLVYFRFFSWLMELIVDDQKDRSGEVSNAMNLLSLIKEMVYFLYWGLILFVSPPFFLFLHLLPLFNCYPSMNTLIFFYACKQKKKVGLCFFYIGVWVHVPHDRWWDYWYDILSHHKKYRCRSNT